MEAAIHEQLGCAGCGRKIEIVPQLAARTGKNCLGVGLIAVKTLGQMQDSLQVFDQLAVPAVELPFGDPQFLERLAHQVFCENCFFTVGLVLRSAGLEIEADSKFMGMLTFESSKLPQLFTRNHVYTPIRA